MSTSGARCPAMMLLHGWPYDIHSYIDVAPVMASRGYRVVVPYVRGFNYTFLVGRHHEEWPAIGARRGRSCPDGCVEPRPGHRRGLRLGGRTACAMASLWPERCKGLVAVSGYIIVNLRRIGYRWRPRRSRAGVPVLLRHRTRPARLRQEPSRIRKARLEGRLPEMGLRRCDLRPQRPGVRKP